MTPERFMEIVVESGDCILWVRCKNQDGYGRLRHNGRLTSAHIYAYEMFVGPTNGLCVLHTCDTPACVNIEHLFLGTHTTNMRDALMKGHHVGYKKLTEKQVLDIRDDYARRRFSYPRLAKFYGVSSGCISAIVKRKSWAHI